jgi:predicted nucleotidyltransferase
MERVEAERRTMLRALVGSTLFGLALEGTDDRDEMGVCIEPIERAVGFSDFEQFIYRDAAVREGRHDAPSAPGDLDLVIYSLRKFVRLAAQGNPTVLQLLFIPASSCIVRTALGAQLQELAPAFVSKEAGKRYLGYMTAQRQRLLGERGQKNVNRQTLVAAHGYDTKYAMHMLRLGFQGVEILQTGRVSLPMPESERLWLMSVRRGEVSMQDALTKAGELEREVKDLLDTSHLPEHADRPRIERWMTSTYLEWWKCAALQPTPQKDRATA